MPTMGYTEILAELTALVGRYAKSSANIEESTELVGDLGFDSLLVMEIVQEVEDAFDISLPLNELAEVRTLKDFVLQIQRELEA